MSLVVGFVVPATLGLIFRTGLFICVVVVRLTVICLIQHIIRSKLHLILSFINFPLNWPWIYSLRLLWLRRWNVGDWVLAGDLAGTIACSCRTGCWLVLILDLPMRLWCLWCVVSLDIATAITWIVSLWSLNHVNLVSVLRWNNVSARHLALCILRMDVFSTPFDLSRITIITHTFSWSCFVGVTDFDSSVSPSWLLPFDIIRFWCWWLQCWFGQGGLSIRTRRIVIFSCVRIVCRVVKDDIWRKAFDNPCML